MSSPLSVVLTIAVVGVLLIGLFLLVALKTPSQAETISFEKACQLVTEYLQEDVPKQYRGDVLSRGRQDADAWLVEVTLMGASISRYLVCKHSGRVTAVGRAQRKRVSEMAPYSEQN